ncbi:MAG: endonuclease/exonuclease/phosphatase family metal-dependent hydrolase [Pseudohongiellaceae bacterium]|jgi:endonuclease/exonuclease/phosphatase family metal-dependent hydrolase
MLKCLSYNIHKGFSQTNARYLLDDIRYAIRQTDADLVFLQEVIGKNIKHQRAYKNWPNESQFEFLADQVWPHFAYGKNAIYQHGHHGNAILSSHPFNHWKNFDISRWNFSQRGILHGVINQGIYVYCIHFGLLAIEKNFQFKQLLNVISNTAPPGAPLIIAGDFNDWRGSLDKKIQQELGITDVFKQLDGKLARTFPAKLPLFSMDRIYTRGFTVSKTQKLLSGRSHDLSDHCAIYCEIDLTFNPPSITK